MFGYVKVNKPEMKIKEYETYKGVYCSLCKAMGKYFGILSRFSLSYDITFLVITRLCFSRTVPCFENGRCFFNPAKKCNYCKNADEQLKYAAAVSIMLFYFKVKDNISDSNFLKRVLMYLILPWASLKYKKAKKMYGEIATVIEESMILQKEIENKNSDITDEAAHPSAHALGKITAYNLDDPDGSIYSFGYGIGKWVYLMDAADDIEKDIKYGSYNVFVTKYDLRAGENAESIKDAIAGTMNMCAGFFYTSYEKIENKTMLPIIENIIYDGMFKIRDNILNKEKSKGNDDNERSL